MQQQQQEHLQQMAANGQIVFVTGGIENPTGSASLGGPGSVHSSPQQLSHLFDPTGSMRGSLTASLQGGSMRGSLSGSAEMTPQHKRSGIELLGIVDESVVEPGTSSENLKEKSKKKKSSSSGSMRSGTGVGSPGTFASGMGSNRISMLTAESEPSGSSPFSGPGQISGHHLLTASTPKPSNNTTFPGTSLAPSFPQNLMGPLVTDVGTSPPGHQHHSDVPEW